MKNKKFAILIFVFIVFCSFTHVKSASAYYAAQNVWQNSLYGGMIGSLAGIGLCLLTDKPSDHTDYISKGAGIGILVGLFYGAYESRAMIVSENGKFEMNFPHPIVSYENPNSNLYLPILEVKF